MMNESSKNKGQPDGSIDQITSLPDFYEDFRPEEIDEIFSTAFAQGDRSIHHQNIFLFFTRCG